MTQRSIEEVCFSQKTGWRTEVEAAFVRKVIQQRVKPPTAPKAELIAVQGDKGPIYQGVMVTMPTASYLMYIEDLKDMPEQMLIPGDSARALFKLSPFLVNPMQYEELKRYGAELDSAIEDAFAETDQLPTSSPPRKRAKRQGSKTKKSKPEVPDVLEQCVQTIINGSEGSESDQPVDTESG